MRHSVIYQNQSPLVNARTSIRLQGINKLMIVIYFNWECIFHNLLHEIKDYDHCLNFYYVSFVMLNSIKAYMHTQTFCSVIFFLCGILCFLYFLSFFCVINTWSFPFIYIRKKDERIYFQLQAHKYTMPTLETEWRSLQKIVWGKFIEKQSFCVSCSTPRTHSVY